MDGQNLLWLGRKRTTEPKRNFDVKKNGKREEKKAEIKLMKFYFAKDFLIFLGVMLLFLVIASLMRKGLQSLDNKFDLC